MGAIIFIILFAVSVLVAMALSAVVVGLSGVLFFDQGFVDGWTAAWDRPGWLFLFGIIAAWLLNNTRDK